MISSHVISPQSRRVAEVFNRSAATYESVGVDWFVPIATSLVDAVGIAAGDRVLDIGCGRGAALFAAADRVGASPAVTGIDLAPGMIEALLADLAEREVTADVRVDDAMAPDLTPETYDAIVSSLVLFFLPAPAAALEAWHALLVPGGRLGVSTFGRQSEQWLQVDALFTPYLPQQLLDARASGTRGPFASDAGVEDLLSGAGFVEPRTTTVSVTARFRDVEHWAQWSWSHGQRVMWENVPRDKHEDVLAQAAQLLSSGDNGIELQQDVRLTTARRRA